MTVSNSALHMRADYLESIGENADTHIQAIHRLVLR